MKIKLYWTDFYKIMIKKGYLEFDAFEKYLKKTFRKQFGCKVKIEWMD